MVRARLVKALSSNSDDRRHPPRSASVAAIGIKEVRSASSAEVHGSDMLRCKPRCLKLIPSNGNQVKVDRRL